MWYALAIAGRALLVGPAQQYAAIRSGQGGGQVCWMLGIKGPRVMAGKGCWWTAEGSARTTALPV